MESARSPEKREATPLNPSEIKWYCGMVFKFKDPRDHGVTRQNET